MSPSSRRPVVTRRLRPGGSPPPTGSQWGYAGPLPQAQLRPERQAVSMVRGRRDGVAQLVMAPRRPQPSAHLSPTRSADVDTSGRLWLSGSGPRLLPQCEIPAPADNKASSGL
ncbi:hypothetical protein NDU88_003820 [Pleurodeles waltl]|uniref:Uncharacterized protein n=1 Tax=Pleurodeles waltl TaxID=8319 RepID=A0AAV7V128_PLEWA|nr:hypothetical protein NDU88_003820 [Pleurodeles waltl]